MCLLYDHLYFFGVIVVHIINDELRMTSAKIPLVPEPVQIFTGHFFKGQAQLMLLALKDKYHGLRAFTMGKLDFKNETVKKQAEPILTEIAQRDPRSTVRANALAALAQYNNGAYKSLFTKSVNDSSYTIAGTALDALFKLDSGAAVAEAKRLAKYPAKGKLVESMTSILVKSGDENGFDIIAKAFEDMPISQAKFNLLQPFCEFLGVVKDTEKLKKRG